MQKITKIKIEDKYVLGVLFTKMKPTVFFRLFEMNESDTCSVLAMAAMEHAAKTDRKFLRADQTHFEFSERIWPKPKKNN